MNEFNLFFQLGLQHILSWSSWDHLLFLLSLIIVFDLKEYKKILGVISLFALAHTMSLFLSAQQIIKVNERLVETLILYTILITAFTNILFPKGEWMTRLHYFFAFFFGLIHGLGFARDFKMIVPGNRNMVLPLLEFTLGIEVAQIIVAGFIVLLSFILLRVFSVNKKEFIKIISAFVIGYTLALMH